MPLGWALDAEGAPTTDAHAGMAGAILPFGGDKGANVGLLVELFAAVLTGAAQSRQVAPYAVAEGDPPDVVQYLIALDPDGFAPGFADRLQGLADAILAQPGVRMPGDRRLACRATAERDGVDVPLALRAQIEEAVS